MLSARKLLWEVVAAVHNLHFIQHLLYPLFPIHSIYARINQWQFNIFKNRQFINEVKTLEDETYIMLPQIRPFAFIEFGDFDAIEHETAGIRVI